MSLPLWLLLAVLTPRARAASDYPLPPAPAASTATTVMTYSADHLDYASTSTVLHLKGHVVIHESTYTVKADELWLDMKDHTARSPGYLLVETSTSAATGTSGSFNFATHTGHLENPQEAYNQWRVKGRRMTLADNKKLDYEAAQFTSCDYIPPHYHFSATRLWVVPKKYLFARNVVFYIAKIPLFYTPIFYKSLKPGGGELIHVKVQVGDDRRNGAFIKTTTLLNLSPHTYGKVYLDEYARQGLGEGAELQHRDRGNRAGVFLYHIKETSTGSERWAGLGDVFQVLRTSLTAQGRGQVQSDPVFMNDYARSNLFPVSSELINNGALTYRLKRSLWRLSYSRVDMAAGSSGFFKYTESAPRLDFNTQSLKVWKLPWLNTFSGFVDNVYQQGQPFIQRSVNGQWEATRTLNLARGVSFTPRTVYSQTFYNRFDQLTATASSSTAVNSFIGRYTGQGTVRWKSPVGDVDLGQTYTARQAPDSMARDVDANDHGVEQNLTSLVDAIRPNRKVLLRLFSAYDERIYRDHIVGFRDRVQPMVGDLIYTPSFNLNFSIHDAYQLDGGNQSLVFNGSKGDILHSFFSLGLGYNKSESTSYFANTEFGYEPSSGTWRAAAALRAVAYSSGGPQRLSHPGLFDKEISLTKNWHDFYGKAQIVFRPGDVREYQVRAQLKFGGERPDAPVRRDWESEFFPDRAGPFVDRP